VETPHIHTNIFNGYRFLVLFHLTFMFLFTVAV